MAKGSHKLVPPTPTGLTGVGVSTTQIQLTWNASPSATKYYVLRGGVRVGSPTATTYTDSGLVSTTTYSYQVEAANRWGTSGPTMAFQVKPLTANVPPPPPPPPPTFIWQQLLVGAGGLAGNVSFGPSGTGIVRLDTSGPFVTSDITAGWTPVNTKAAIPALDLSPNMSLGCGPAAEVAACPSDNNTLYFMGLGDTGPGGNVNLGGFFKSTNKGANWTKQSDWNNGALLNYTSGLYLRHSGPYMAVDPTTTATIWMGYAPSRINALGNCTTAQSVIPTSAPQTNSGFYINIPGGDVYDETTAQHVGTIASVAATQINLNANAANAVTTNDVLQIGGGLFVSTNSGVSWTRIPDSKVPRAATIVENNAVVLYPFIIAIDPNNNSRIVAFSWGNGFYQTLNGGTSFAKLTGAGATPPTTCCNMTIDKFGNLWVLDVSGGQVQSGNLYVYPISSSIFTNNQWTQITAAGTSSTTIAVAYDPSWGGAETGNKIYTSNANSQLTFSLDGGQSWNTSAGPTESASGTGQIHWINVPEFLIKFAYDTGHPGTIFATSGVGGKRCSSLPTVSNGALAWTESAGFGSSTGASKSGIEQIVARCVTIPPGGFPIVGGDDRGFFTIQDYTDYPQYYNPQLYWNNNGSTAGGTFLLCTGAGIDYAKTDPTFVVGAFGQQSTGGYTLFASGSFSVGASTITFTTDPGVGTIQPGMIVLDQTLSFATVGVVQSYNSGTKTVTLITGGSAPFNGSEINSSGSADIIAIQGITSPYSTNSGVGNWSFALGYPGFVDAGDFFGADGTIAVYDHNHWVWGASNNMNPMVTGDGGKTWVSLGDSFFLLDAGLTNCSSTYVAASGSTGATVTITGTLAHGIPTGGLAQFRNLGPNLFNPGALTIPTTVATATAGANTIGLNAAATATANGSFSIGNTTISLLSNPGVPAGYGVFDNTTNSTVGTVLSITGTGPFTLTLNSGSLINSSGASDTLAFYPKVNAGDYVWLYQAPPFGVVWAGSEELVLQYVTCDSAGSFYLFSQKTGSIYKSAPPNYGAAGTWTIDTTGLDTNGSVPFLKAVPQFGSSSTANHVLLCPGISGATFQTFYQVVNGTATAVSGTSNVGTFGFGKPSSGNPGYPTVFIWGKVVIGGVPTQGVWRSDNYGPTWASSPTWVSVGSFPSMEVVCCMEGDPNVFGSVIVGTLNEGWFRFG